jgi:hypothetical protein
MRAPGQPLSAAEVEGGFLIPAAQSVELAESRAEWAELSAAESGEPQVVGAIPPAVAILAAAIPLTVAVLAEPWAGATPQAVVPWAEEASVAVLDMAGWVAPLKAVACSNSRRRAFGPRSRLNAVVSSSCRWNCRSNCRCHWSFRPLMMSFQRSCPKT